MEAKLEEPPWGGSFHSLPRILRPASEDVLKRATEAEKAERFRVLHAGPQSRVEMSAEMWSGANLSWGTVWTAGAQLILWPESGSAPRFLQTRSTLSPGPATPELEVALVDHAGHRSRTPVTLYAGELAGREPRGFVPHARLEPRVEMGELTSQAGLTVARHSCCADGVFIKARSPTLRRN
jgi:hypothetical protein